MPIWTWHGWVSFWMIGFVRASCGTNLRVYRSISHNICTNAWHAVLNEFCGTVNHWPTIRSWKFIALHKSEFLMFARRMQYLEHHVHSAISEFDSADPLDIMVLPNTALFLRSLEPARVVLPYLSVHCAFQTIPFCSKLFHAIPCYCPWVMESHALFIIF